MAGTMGEAGSRARHRAPAGGVLALTLAAALSACGGDGPATGPDGPERWTLADTPLVSIGTVEGNADYLLSNVADVLLLDDGVLVADAGSGSIRRYDGAGTLVVRMGRTGQGPGEFVGLTALESAGADTVWAFDGDGNRLTAFLRSGALVNTVDVRADGGLPDVYLGRLASGAHALAWIRQAVDRGPGPVTPDPMVVGLFGADGRLLRIVGEGPGMRRGPTGPLPFSPHFVGAVVDDRVYFTDGSGPSMSVAGAGSDTVRTVSADVPPPPSAEAAFEALAAVADTTGIGWLLERIPEYRALPGADSIPTFSDVFADADGRLWLKRYAPATDSHSVLRRRTGGEWAVVDPDGAVVALVAMPADFRPMSARGGRVAGVARDAVGVERVRVYEFASAAPGSDP